MRGLYISYDRNYTYLGIRGFGRPTDYNNRLLVMIDGHSMNEHVFGSANIGSELALDLSEVDRIEFVRGPGSVLYGSGAMFGVINVITRRADSAGVLRVEASAGSAGRRGGAVAFGRSFGETSVRVAANRRSTEGLDLHYREYEESGHSDGVAHGLDYDDVFGVMASLTRRDLRVSAFLSHRRKGIPTGAFETNFDERSETLDEQRFMDVLYTPQLSARSQLEIRAFLDSYRYFGNYAYDKTISEDSDGLFSGAEVRAMFDLRSNHRLTVGAQYIDELRMEYGQTGSANRTRTNTDQWSTYAQYEYQPLENLSTVAGLRFDHQAGYGGRTTPRLAIIFHPNQSAAVKLLYGEAFRRPTPWERDYEDVEYGYLANRELEDESIRTSEIVWEQRLSPEVLAVFSAYHFSVNDLIAQHANPERGLLQFVNRGSVSSRGLEMELNYRSANGFWSFMNYAIQKAEERGEWSPNSPQHIVSMGASAPLTKRLNGGIELLYESARRTVVGTETRPFAIANATFSARLAGGLSLVGLVRNAFDTAYAVPGGYEHRQAAIDQDGRSFLVRLVYQR